MNYKRASRLYILIIYVFTSAFAIADTNESNKLNNDLAILSDIAQVISSVAAVIALFALIWQNRKFNFSLQVETLLRMEERFDSKDMRAMRKACVNIISASRAISDTDDRQRLLDQMPEDVLDFFDGVGLLVKKGGLDEEMTWNNLSHWAIMYWKLTEEYRQFKTKSNGSNFYWVNYGMLIKKFKRRHRKNGTNILTDEYTIDSEEINDFIKNESAL